jgi:hypothetical protein
MPPIRETELYHVHGEPWPHGNGPTREELLKWGKLDYQELLSTLDPEQLELFQSDATPEAIEARGAVLGEAWAQRGAVAAEELREWKENRDRRWCVVS